MAFFAGQLPQPIDNGHKQWDSQTGYGMRNPAVNRLAAHVNITDAPLPSFEDTQTSAPTFWGSRHLRSATGGLSGHSATNYTSNVQFKDATAVALPHSDRGARSLVGDS